jgi:prephenate dehydrogenase
VAAAKAGAITEIAHGPEDVVRGADVVVLAEPPVTAVHLLERLAPMIRERGIVCTDVASVKAPATRMARRMELADHFAGSHPFVGLENAPFGAARPDLLEQALVYVTPTEGGEQAAREVSDFWKRAVGAQPVTLDAARHDACVAWTGHLPRAAASVLAAALAERGPEGVTYAPGTLEATRPAASDAGEWAELLWLNREQMAGALEGVRSKLEELRSLLASGSQAELRRWLEDGARWRERFDQ